MPKNSENAVESTPALVYIVSRYSQIVGVYEDFQDAVQVANVSIAKGHLARIEPFNVSRKNSMQNV